MTVTAASFRTNFPEFGNTTTYTDPQVNFYLGIAALALSNVVAWDAWLDQGTSLFVAHNLVLSRRRQRTAAAGGTPGISAGGPVSSKGVDKVSVGYDTAAGTLEKGGSWNLTDYGVQFLQLARLIGAQAVTQL